MSKGRVCLSGEKGFALVLAVFLAAAFSVVTVSMMHGGAQQARTVQRTVDRIKLNWAAEGLVDMGLYYFDQHMALGIGDGFGYPTTDASGEAQVDAGEILLSQKLTEWFGNSTLRTSGISVTQLNFKQTLPDPNGSPSPYDSFRRYAITVRLEMDKGTGEPPAEVYGVQEFEATGGRIMEYSSFFNNDLEVAPGPSTTFQGPLFSNADIYLNIGAGQTLTLKAPADTSVPTARDYIMATHGNVYFYSKRALARNYLKDVPLYKNLLDKLGVSPSSVGLSFYNQEQEMSSFSGATYDQGPFPYYFTSNDSANAESKILLADAEGNYLYGNETDSKLGGPFPSVNGYTNWSWWQTYGWTGVQYSYNYISDSTIMSSSRAVDNALFPEDPVICAGWTVENPVCPGDPDYRPLPKLSFAQIDAVQDGWIKQGVAQKAIPVGGVTSSHILIEPSTGLGDLNNKVKFECKADVVLKCAGGSCVAYKNYADECGDQRSGEGSVTWSIRSFWDYRMGREVYATFIDVNSLRASDDRSDDGLTVYVKVEAENGDVVVLDNGQEPPVTCDASGICKGFTLATNGRLWVRGDFNIWSTQDPYPSQICHYNDIVNGNCKVPPVALYADSFGVLSAGYNVLNNGTTSLSDRKATADISVNAAVFAGQIPSRLEELYSHCKSDAALGGYTGTPPCRRYPLGPEVAGHTFQDAATGIPYLDRTGYQDELDQIATRWVAEGVNAGAAAFLRDPGENIPAYIIKRIQDPEGVPTVEQLTSAAGWDWPGLRFMTLTPTFKKLNCIYGPLGKGKLYPSSSACDYTTGDEGGDPGWSCPDPWWGAKVLDSGLLSYKCLAYPEQLFDLREADQVIVDKFPSAALPPDIYFPDSEGRFELQTAANYKTDMYGRLWKYGFDGGTGADCKKTNLSGGVNDCQQLLVRGSWVTGDNVNPLFGIAPEALLSVYIVQLPGYSSPLGTTNAVRLPNGDFRYLYALNQWCLGLTGDRDTPIPDRCYHPHEAFPVTPPEYPNAPPAMASPGTPAYAARYEVNYYPDLRYAHTRQFPLYETRYSGGLENLINFQEDWREGTGTRIFFSGILSALWDAEYLKKGDGTPAYFTQDIYVAPERYFDYNETLRENPPPSTPGLYTLNRKRFLRSESGG